MNTLKQKLEEFAEWPHNTEDELTNAFEKLAPYFLYGGYIRVRNEFKVYIRSVEFYFHSEEDGIYDPIVYHRNGHGLEHVPYFPTMTLHAHNSGFDITFENSTNKYRASALIRSYEVIDKEGKYLKWEKVEEGHYMFIQKDNYCYNTQSTCLYTLINGFALGNDSDINWEQEQREVVTNITSDFRQNVPLYKKINATLNNNEAEFEKVTKDYYYKSNDTELIRQVPKPQFFTYDKVRYLKDPRLWQFKRNKLHD